MDTVDKITSFTFVFNWTRRSAKELDANHATILAVWEILDFKELGAWITVPKV